ncbi:MAG: rhomboid family intramembrane serine protease [Chitinophagaceae bacterium]|nr:rhomboid family intramembrane serine protease [Chitinophagaceae bacterium]
MSVLEQNSRRKMMLGQDGNSLTTLLIINIVAFVLLNFVKIVYLLTDDTEAVFTVQVLNWFTLPANPATLATRPWTLLTYMFTHYNIWLLISNLLWLWCFGYILQDLAGNKKLIPIYLYGGFAGGIFFMLTISAFPGLRANIANIAPMMGAGPATVALAVATTAISPKYKIFPLINGGIPLWVLSAIFVLIHFTTSGISHPGFAAADVAGGLMGFVFVWQMQKGNDWSDWMINLTKWIEDLFNPEKKHRKKVEKQRLFYKPTKQPFQKTPHVTQQRIDELLDKINQKGYNFLSDEEKDFLKKASKEEF